MELRRAVDIVEVTAGWCFGTRVVALAVASVAELSVASAVDVSLRARSFSLFFTICAPRFSSNEMHRINATIPTYQEGAHNLLAGSPFTG